MSEDTAQQRPVRVLAIAGSLREASYSRRLTRLAATLDTDGVELVEFDGLGLIEPFDEDLETTGWPPGAAAWRTALEAVDAVFVATPEYNASIPGALKNAFDWASRASEPPFDAIATSPMYGMPVAVISSSTGQFGGVWARDELVKSLRTQGARAVTEPKVAVAAAHQAFDDSGDLRHAPTRTRLGELLQALAAQARALREARTVAATPGTLHQ